MRVAVLGAGAVGSLFGALLSDAHDVTLIGRRPHVEAVNRSGLRITGKTEMVARPHAVTDAASAPTPDLLLVTVKAPDTEAAIRGAKGLVGPGTRVLTLQNGLGNIEALQTVVPPERVVAGTITVGATFMGPGHVQHTGVGYVKLGSPAGDRAGVEAVAEAFRAAGLDPEVVGDILSEVWAKVVVNAGINPITAITGLPNGALVEEPPLRRLMERACDEAISVAGAEGVRLPDDDLVVRTAEVAELTAANKSSMLQDVERGRPTEIDAISGEVVRRGERHGVDTPVNAALAALVKGIELTTRR